MKRSFLRLKKKIMTNEYIISGIVFLLILSIVFFYFNNFKLPKVINETEAKVRQEVDVEAMPKVLVATVTDPEGIGKYTELTDKLIDEKIQLVEVPEPFAIHHGVSSLEELRGMVLKQDFRVGEQISKFALTEASKWYGRYDRLKEYHVKTIVADTVQVGHLVDVIIHYGNGDYDVLLSKVEVRGLIRGTETGLEPDETNPWNLYRDNDYLVTFAVDEKDYMNMKLAENLSKVVSLTYQRNLSDTQANAFNGFFELRAYIDEDQPESVITFNYDKRLKQLEDILEELETEALDKAQNMIQETDMNHINEAREREAMIPYFEDLQESESISDEDYQAYIRNYNEPNNGTGEESGN